MGRQIGAIVLLTLATACVSSDPDGEGADVVTVPAAVEESTQPVVDTTTPRTSTTLATTTTALPATTTTASLAGTRQNPLDPGTKVRVGDWEVTYVGAVLDGTDVVLERNQFNDPPVEGRQFVLLELEGTYVGEDSGTWWLDLRVSVLGSAANTFGGDFDDFCGVIPDDIGDANETFPGGQVSGSECISVSSDQLDGALVFIESLITFGDDDRTFYKMVP